MFKALIVVALFSTGAFAQDKSKEQNLADGAVKSSKAWDASHKQWVSLEQFWLNFAEREGGLTWGRSDTYPEYDKVNEFDTFMVETSQGPCLMQFFHSRWRRANDVQRWDDAFNEYQGCPYVFD